MHRETERDRERQRETERERRKSDGYCAFHPIHKVDRFVFLLPLSSKSCVKGIGIRVLSFAFLVTRLTLKIASGLDERVVGCAGWLFIRKKLPTEQGVEV